MRASRPGPGSSRTDKLAAARTAPADGNSAGASTALAAFRKELRAQSGTKIAPDVAATLDGAAARVVAVVG